MRIAVIGGGASGMMASYAAANEGAEVILFEQNEKLGKKLFITGKGRCNLTNASSTENHIANVVNHPRFLYSAYKAFSPFDLMTLIEENGTPLKTERGDRVFPQSDKSSDILNALERLLRTSHVTVRLMTKVLSITAEKAGFLLETDKGREHFEKVVICTGGITYKATGSTGDGYRFANQFGHKITDLYPALVGIRAVVPSEMAGLSLKNVTLSVHNEEKELASEFGEMLFTHTGLSGPIVLTLSSKINRMDLSKLTLCLDLKPALSAETVDARLVREFAAGQNKAVKNILPSLMPKSLISFVLGQSGIKEDIPCHSITKSQRRRIVEVIKRVKIAPVGFEEFNGAIITSGGVDVTEVDPKDMQSKLRKGLYFAGEVLDVDALTGGYNLQIAFSTGYLAGRKAANSCEQQLVMIEYI